MRFLGLFLACMDASRLECEPLVVLKFMKPLQFLAAILSFGALHTNSSRRFVESLGRIDNCLRNMLMLLRTFSENHGIGYQSFSEIGRISKKY
jgi:hypothetical protein